MVKRVALWIIGAALVMASLVVIRSVLIGINHYRFAQFWDDLSAQSAAPGELTLVALGDSTVQAIGADKPLDGFVGRLARYVESKHHRKVHIVNLSHSGDKVGHVIKDQLPKLKNYNPEIIVLAAGINDAVWWSDETKFRENYRYLLSQLPAEKTVAADIPNLADRASDDKIRRWNSVIATELTTRNMEYAKLYDAWQPHKNDHRVYSADYFHPSDFGYALWAKAFEPGIDGVIRKQ